MSHVTRIRLRVTDAAARVNKASSISNLSISLISFLGNAPLPPQGRFLFCLNAPVFNGNAHLSPAFTGPSSEGGSTSFVLLP